MFGYAYSHKAHILTLHTLWPLLLFNWLVGWNLIINPSENTLLFSLTLLACFCIVGLVFFRVHIRPLEGSSVLCLLFVRSGLLCRLTLCFCLALLHFLNNYQKSHRRHRHLKKVVMIGSVNPIPNSIKLSRSDVMLIQIVVSILLRHTNPRVSILVRHTERYQSLIHIFGVSF